MYEKRLTTKLNMKNPRRPIADILEKSSYLCLAWFGNEYYQIVYSSQCMRVMIALSSFLLSFFLSLDPACGNSPKAPSKDVRKHCHPSKSEFANRIQDDSACCLWLRTFRPYQNVAARDRISTHDPDSQSLQTLWGIKRAYLPFGTEKQHKMFEQKDNVNKKWDLKNENTILW